MTSEEFRELIWQRGRELYREMPWRRDTRPYFVLVSELMLQQTQVARVVPKFEAFIARFPSEHELARASLADVLALWQGLGYNRRAKFLHQAARQIVELGVFPDTYEGLVALPGVGKNTAGALLAYAYNQPALFIETNVRTVYLHHLFAGQVGVSDAEILTRLASTIDHEHPREWYWALMDYGAWLKSQGVRNNAASKSYKKQSPLKGSVREIRGQIIKVLSERGELIEAELQALVTYDERYLLARDGLVADGLVRVQAGRLRIVE